MIKFFSLTAVILLLSCTYQAHTQASDRTRIIVVGGGGARGAWAGGFAQHMRDDNNAHYKAAFGTSTGSLLAPLIVLESYSKLREAYTSVNQKDIFSYNPFNEKTGQLRVLNAIWRIIIGKETFGTTYALRNLMDRFLTQKTYNRIRRGDSLEFTVTVMNMKTGKAEYKCSNDYRDADSMKDWMWASANEPLFMNYLRRDGNTYVDGGVVDNVPVAAALEYASRHPDVTDIDVLINKPVNPLVQQQFNTKKIGIIKGLQRLIDIWTLEVRNDDILIALLKAYISGSGQSIALANDNSPKVVIHTYYFPSERFDAITQKELLFNQQRMNILWEAGLSGEYDKSGQEDIVVPQQLLTPMINSFQKSIPSFFQ